jgi:outer membrane protein assembly factor BamB
MGMMRISGKVALMASLFVGAVWVEAGNWPEWRGPQGDGLVADSNYARQWSASDNVLWKTALPDAGNSSPVIWGNRVFVTCSEDGGKERSLICFDRSDGAILWKRSVRYEKDDPTHATNPWCAASPATDGKAIYVWNGSAGATAYDFEGREIWHRDLGAYVHMWGHASSPRIYQDTVIFFGSPGPRVVLTALDRESGETVWTRELDEVVSPPQELHGSFVTPYLWQNGERDELLIPLPGYLASFDPATGSELWRCDGLGQLTYTDAMVGEDVILAFSGYRGPAIGMRKPGPKDTGNLTESHRIWKNDTVVQRVGSGVIVGNRYYLCSCKGELQCGDIHTGEIIWSQDLREQNWGAISLVGEDLYLTDQSSVTRVFAPKDRFELRYENQMEPGERSNATIGFHGGVIFLRTFKHLYAIGPESR